MLVGRCANTLHRQVQSLALLKVGLISLGCPKNLVDSEEILGTLAGDGCCAEPDCSRADVIIVNTCGFIEKAKQESVDAILEAARFKERGRCRSLIVTGCLAQRYAEELSREIPEVDAFVGVGRYRELPGVIRETLGRNQPILDSPSQRGQGGTGLLARKGSGEAAAIVRTPRPPEKWIESIGRVRSTPPWTAYLKISDGCDNRCAYCAIPDIRGRYRSRPPGLILAEAERLAAEGTKELNLVGQDITLYGADLDGGWTLERLLGELVRLDVKWIRLLYCYPTRVTEDLIRRIADEPKIARYMDLPLQHGDDDVLRRMGRRGTSGDYLALIGRLRAACPDIALRSSFIVGFPGETESEFENLLRFVEQARLDRAGAFTYSREEGTRAAAMGKQVSRRVAEKRYARLMDLQQQISLERNREMVGREIDVLVESEEPAVGRSYRDAPEIDGVVYLQDGKMKAGQFVRAVVTEAREYDLTAKTGR